MAGVVEQGGQPFTRFAKWCADRGISRQHGYRLRDAGILEVSYLGSMPVVTREAEQRMLERLGTSPGRLGGG